MVKLIMLLFMCFLLSCAPKSIDDCQFSIDVYGNRIIHKKLPVSLYVSLDVPEEYFEVMLEASRQINKNKNLIQLHRGDVVNGPKQRNFINEVYFNNNYPEDRKSEQGLTSIWWTIKSGIQETDVVFNTKHFDYSEGKVDFKTLVVHEFLHVLGMRHQEDNKHGIMYPYLPFYETRGMTEREYKNLECAYGK